MGNENPEDEIYAHITATPGHEITVTFNEASGGGYIWAADAHDNVDISSERLSDDVDYVSEPVIGGNGKRKFTISSEIEGTHELTFRHQRPFEDEPEEVVKIILDIQP